jgi:hypothetical protein
MSRILLVYLIFYFGVILVAALALWASGVLGHLPPLWTVAAVLAAVGLGVLLLLVSRKPA